MAVLGNFRSATQLSVGIQLIDLFSRSYLSLSLCFCTMPMARWHTHNTAQIEYFANFYRSNFVCRTSSYVLYPVSIKNSSIVLTNIRFSSISESCSSNKQFWKVDRKTYGVDLDLNYFKIITKCVQMASATSFSWSLSVNLSIITDAHYIFKSFATTHTPIDIINPIKQYWWFIVEQNAVEFFRMAQAVLPLNWYDSDCG